MNYEQLLNEFSKAHSIYEAMALRILIKELRKMFKRINFNNLSFDDALNSAIIQLTVNPLELKKILYKIDYTIGIDWGTKQGKKLAKKITLEMANGSIYPFYSTQFRDKVIDYYNQYGGQNIKSISDTMVKSVVEEIKAGTYQLETVEQMAERIEKTVNNPKFYKWQALRIARTETTFAMNSASSLTVSHMYLPAVSFRYMYIGFESSIYFIFCMFSRLISVPVIVTVLGDVHSKTLLLYFTFLPIKFPDTMLAAL